MTILILYASTEGQTHKIARRSAAHLKLRGHKTEIIAADDPKALDLTPFDHALLMASVHAGHYQDEFIDYVTECAAKLDKLPNAFFSVSLSAASDDPEDIEGIELVARGMFEKTGWTPAKVLHVAGAFRFTQYDFLKSWAMRWIASKRDPDIETDSDTEYTNWQEVYEFLDAWVPAGAEST